MQMFYYKLIERQPGLSEEIKEEFAYVYSGLQRMRNIRKKNLCSAFSF